MGKRILTFAMLVIIVFSLFSFLACDESEFTFELINDGKEYSVIEYTGESKYVAVPDKYKGKPVTEIKFLKLSIEAVEIPAGIERIYDAFNFNSNLKVVTFAIGSKLKTIGTSVFAGCTNIESIKIPAGVENIGLSAFLGCSRLKSITFETGNRLKTIGEKAFDSCSNLESITIPAGVTVFYGECTFFACVNLKSIYFEKGTLIENIGFESFSHCPNLTDIYFGGTEEQWQALNTEDAGISPSITVHFDWDSE